jgi:hypothetical protein
MFFTPVALEEMGFDTVESFLLSLNDLILHMRYVNKKILVYPHANNMEPKQDDPLPHITEVSRVTEYLLLFYLANLQSAHKCYE